MKKLSILFATTLLALFSISCTSGGDDSPSISSNSQNNTSSSSQSNAEGFENSGQITDTKTEKPYTGNGKIYLAEEERGSNGQPILATIMVEAGVMSNGKITFTLPENVDSRFLTKIDVFPPGMEVNPLDAEVWFYNEPFRLLSNGKHIGDFEYIKILNDGTYHKITYFYFSKNTSINGYVEEMGGMEYKIEAKKGWNNVYIKVNTNTRSLYVTTNLNEVPDGLAWLMWEIN